MKKVLSAVVVVALFAAGGGASCRAEGATQNFATPLLSGGNPDPTICRVGDDYYIATSSFSLSPGLPVYRSKDMVNWEVISHAWRESWPCKTPDDGIWAPTLRHHNGVFYLTVTWHDGFKKAENYLLTARDPAGPWSKPMKIGAKSGIDGSLFFDGDDAWYLSNRQPSKQKWRGHCQIWMQRIDLETGRLFGDKHVLTDGFGEGAAFAEGPHLYKIGGKYLLLHAQGGTAWGHMEIALVSDCVTGPYTHVAGNPVLTVKDWGRRSPLQAFGHADLVQMPDGEWRAVFLGMRMTDEGKKCPLGRETFSCRVDLDDNGLPTRFRRKELIAGDWINPAATRYSLLDRPDDPVRYVKVRNLSGRVDYPDKPFRFCAALAAVAPCADHIHDDCRFVAAKLANQFLSTEPDFYCPKGYRAPKAYGGRKLIHYSVVSLWVNALECAHAAGDAELERRLISAFEPAYGEKNGWMNDYRHVDLSIVGAIPLEIAILTGDERAKKLGLRYADRQWEEPREGLDWGDRWYDKIPLAERHAWWEKGYSPETRLWLDDMYMITLLQSQAYRLTGERTYIERAAKEMCLYLERLPRPDGLFNHAPQAPFVWGRGNGWLAAAMAMNLKYLPADSEWRAPILAGYRRMMSALLRWQRSNGLWGQIVNDPESYDETSATAMFAYAFAEGVNAGVLGDEYRVAAVKAYRALVARLDEYGNLPDVCVGTGWKNDRHHYLTRPKANGDPHGQAPMLWLCSALIDKERRAEKRRGVKYCGIFINDEDWGLRPWAVKQFGAEEQIGLRAYERIFALMKANGLNLLWPAMHEGGYEFVSRPENMALAAKYGIRIGTSHCEPMLRNNCYLSKSDKKKWSWLKHRDFMKGYWQWAVDRYATNDVLWTIGIRGIHDGKMTDGETMPEKIVVLEDVFAEQCAMLEAAGAGAAPKLFVPYKEVLPIFNAGLKVPEGTTIMWVNDNFGYVRRLGGPQCAGCCGGIYWHAGYQGRPHGYIHLCTTPPAFMWYELAAKCWENGVRDVWMVNVGDVFQAELAIYALGKFAAAPSSWGPDAQEKILSSWVAENFGENERIAAHLAEYFNLGFIRKPEHMCIQWTSALPGSLKEELKERYAKLLAEDAAIEASLPEKSRDAYFRKVGYQVRFLANAGLIHLEGRGREYAHSVLDPLTARWDALEGGKWSGFWIDTIEEKKPNRWSSQMQWPWNEPKDENGAYKPRTDYVATAYAWERKKRLAEPKWLDAASSIAANGGEWKAVAGLGTSGAAYALLPVKPGVGEGASLTYELPGNKNDGNSSSAIRNSSLVIQFLPDFALWPGMKLRVGVAFDDGESQIVEVPKSDSNIGEKDPVRNAAVQDNFIRVSRKIPYGAKAVKIVAIDPGVVIDRIGVRNEK